MSSVDIKVFYNAKSVILTNQTRRVVFQKHIKERLLETQILGIQNVGQITVIFVECPVSDIEKDSILVEVFSRALETEFYVAGDVIKKIIFNHLVGYPEYEEVYNRIGLKLSVANHAELF